MDAYFYKVMNNEDRKKVISVIKELINTKTDNVLSHAYEKLQDGSCFLVVKCHPYGSDDHKGDPCWKIDSFSFWKRNPSTYRDSGSTFIPKPLTEDVVKWAFDYEDKCSIYYALIKSIYYLTIGDYTHILNFNSYNHGKDQSKLQGEKISDSRCREGSILHYRRNGFEYSAGRHCDQARAQIIEGYSGRYQVELSTRCPEVLGYKSQGGCNGSCTDRDWEASIRAGIQCDNKLTYQRLLGRNFILKSDKDQCIEIGDFYIVGNLILVLVDSQLRTFIPINKS